MHDFHDPSRPALFKAVLDAPADAAPKLVFADWLEESGNADDARMADTLRWMAAFGKWPYLGQIRGTWNRIGAVARWRAFVGRNRTPAPFWEKSAYLSYRVLCRLRLDQMDLPCPVTRFTDLSSRSEWEVSLGVYDTPAEAAAIAIEALSNALSAADIRAAARKRLAVS